MNLLYKHPSGGKLYQGDFQDACNVRLLDSKKIKTVVFAAWECQHVNLPDRFDVIRARLDDNFFPDKAEKHFLLHAVDKVADLVVRAISGGRNVISTCRMGRNRSGVCSAFSLVKLGANPERAISLIQSARKGALSNPAFRRLVRGYGLGIQGKRGL